MIYDPLPPEVLVDAKQDVVRTNPSRPARTTKRKETAAEMHRRLGYDEPTEEQKRSNLEYNLLMIELDK